MPTYAVRPCHCPAWRTIQTHLSVCSGGRSSKLELAGRMAGLGRGDAVTPWHHQSPGPLSRVLMVRHHPLVTVGSLAFWVARSSSLCEDNACPLSMEIQSANLGTRQIIWTL